MPRAFITGINGQDGSYLAELLLEKGYEVFGIIRRSSTFNTSRIDHIFDDLRLFHADLLDQSSLVTALKEAQPDEVYNLAAQSHVAASFQQPEYTMQSTGIGFLRLLEAIRGLGLSPKIYQASSSELFGSNLAPQCETTRFFPESPYAVAKLYAHETARLYREAYGMWIACGILFNHESPRRGERFVTRKVTRAAARIKLGLQDKLSLGALWPQRDWGYAPDFVDGMWRILQLDKPVDLVLATGVSHTVEELCSVAFGLLNLDYREFVVHDPKYDRPREVPHLCGEASRAKELIGWAPELGFTDLVHTLLQHDFALAERELMTGIPTTERTLV